MYKVISIHYLHKPFQRILCRLRHDLIINECALLDMKTKAIQVSWLGEAMFNIIILMTVTHGNF